MATPYFPTFLLLLFLSSFALLLLTLRRPAVAPSNPFSASSPPPPWPPLSCGRGQSWAVRLHSGPRQEGEDGEQSSVELDAVANRVRCCMSPLRRSILIFFLEEFSFSDPTSSLKTEINGDTVFMNLVLNVLDLYG